MREIELLTRVAKQHRTFVSNLTQQPDLKWTALGDLYRMEDKTRFSLRTGRKLSPICLDAQCTFSYEEIGKSLKPFSLQVR